MTPAARIQAAIEILDRAIRGEAAEAVLTGWARSNRFAGSGDRAGIRDLVYDALRCQASYAHMGGGERKADCGDGNHWPDADAGPVAHARGGP